MNNNEQHESLPVIIMLNENYGNDEVQENHQDFVVHAVVEEKTGNVSFLLKIYLTLFNV